MEADEWHVDMSSDDSDDYEPAPIGKVVEDDPPPVPPPRGMTFSSKLHPSLPSSQQTASPRHESLYHTVRTSISMDLKLPHPKGVVQLSDFITRYSTLLPCQVKLLQDIPSVPSASGAIINLHFIKHAKVVVATDTNSGKKNSVPLNSTAKFSILYDPMSDLDEAMNGYHFDTVKDIFSRKSLPLIVRATQCFQGNTALSSVQNGEILLIRGIKTFLRNRQLRVQNLQGQSKHLSEKCSGSFTTDPRQVSLSLPQLLKLGIDLPVRAVAYDAEKMESVVVLERITGETYLIASHPNCPHGELRCFELSSDMDIKVEAVELDPGSRQELIRSTQTLFHSFSSSAMPVTWESEISDGLYGQLLPGRDQEGVQLVRPINIDTVLPTPETTADIEVPIARNGTEDSVIEDEDIYAVLDCTTHAGNCKLEDGTAGQDAVNCRDTMSSTRSKGAVSSDGLCDSLKNLTARVEHLSATFSQQQTAILCELHRLQSIVLDLQTEVQSLAHSKPLLDERYEENRKMIATLNCKQVLKNRIIY